MRIVKNLILAAFSAAVTGISAQPTEVRPPMETRVTWMSECTPQPKPEKPQVKNADDSKAALIPGLVAIVGAKLIGGAIDSAAEALKAAGKDRNAVTTARSGMDFYKVTKDADLLPRAQCLVVVRGIFGDPKKTIGWARNSDDLQGLQKPIFRMEAKSKPLRGGKFFLLEPVLLQVDDFEKFSFFDPKDRDYLVSVSLKLPDGTGPFGSAEFLFRGIERSTDWKEGDPRLRMSTSRPVGYPTESADTTKVKKKVEGLNAPYLLAIDILSKPPEVKGKAPSLLEGTSVGSTSELFCSELHTHNTTLPKQYALNDERCGYVLEKSREAMEKELDNAHRSEERSKWARRTCAFKDEKGDVGAECENQAADPAIAEMARSLQINSYTYFNTDLTLTETTEGSKLALWLGNALSASSDEVVTAIGGRILPKTDKQKADETLAEAEARANARIAALQVTNSEEALAELLAKDHKPSEATAARIALLKSKIAANKAARQAYQPIPFPEVD